MTQAARLRRWQWVTAGSLFSGYAAYYLCRSNLSVATPILLREFGPHGLTKESMGLVASAGVAAYALGKVFNGLLADRLGGRRLFLGGLGASILCTIVFALAGSAWAFTGVAIFVTIWAANRLVQSAGWVALVNIASRWFPVSRHATIMAFLSCSFLVGDAASRAYLGGLIRLGESQSQLSALADWRTVFAVSAGTSLVVLLVLLKLLRADPGDIGAEEPPANSANVYANQDSPGVGAPHDLRQILGPLMRSRLFWTVCLTNLCLTLVRETFNFWTPTFLTERVSLSPGAAAAASLTFPLAGAAAALICGVLSDRLGGRHGRIMVPSILGLICSLLLLGAMPLDGRPAMAIFLIGLVALFLMGPYSYLSGVMALDIGGKHGSGTAAGLSDAAGYGGAILSGHTVGLLAERLGWSSAFYSLAGVSVLGLISALMYSRCNESLLGRRHTLNPESQP